jgi:phosphate transport system permease protein
VAITEKQASSPAPAPREITTQPRRSDQVFRSIVFLGGLSSLVILSAIALFLGIRGFEIITREGLKFITGYEWYSSINADGLSGDQPSVYGIGAMLIGTIITALIAVVIGVPVAVATALFLNFYAPNFLKGFLVSVVDLMAAFPSILFGLWGLNVLMPSAEYFCSSIYSLTIRGRRRFRNHDYPDRYIRCARSLFADST